MKVLFLCTGNSCRSILAEATFNHLAPAGWSAMSAGSHPTGEIHPRSLALLAREGIPTAGCRSKSWEHQLGDADHLRGEGALACGRKQHTRLAAHDERGALRYPARDYAAGNSRAAAGTHAVRRAELSVFNRFQIQSVSRITA